MHSIFRTDLLKTDPRVPIGKGDLLNLPGSIVSIGIDPNDTVGPDLAPEDLQLPA
jgi:hypothetical protein